ncbi:sulfotransferase family protein [Geminocystis sp. CENA526]|uniref:sulfotransferase family protein n=1 Tax=Geminocystis sp. CENA526 TaxID=1355871 RepID=UPI003D6EC80D
MKLLQCQKSPFYKIYPPNINCLTVNSRINISHTRKFCYFRIPKAANSTVIISLFNAEYENLDFEISDNHSNIKSQISRIKSQMYDHPSSLSVKQLKELLDNYYKFTFVRNPYTRFLSCFLDKVKRPEAEQRKMICNFLKKSSKENISIHDFLDFLEYKTNLNCNAHWCLQKDILLLPKEKIDFIGRVENLQQDLITVMQVIFNKEIDDQIVNIKSHSTGANSKLAMICDPEIKERIFKIYEADFEYFEYSQKLEL